MSEDKTIKNDIHSSGFILQSVILNSSRMTQELDLRGVVSDIHIYEHLDKAYLTADLMFVDSFKVADRLDIQGAETITITIKRSVNSPEYVKRFVIKKINKAQKNNNGSETFSLRLIEEIAFKSNLYNINRSYEGSPSSIITAILKKYLNVDLKIAGNEDVQGNIKLIVPNMNVMETIEWIRNRSTTNDGYPFFCFSTLSSDNIYYSDLETLLKNTPLNDSYPMIYSPSVSVAETNNRLFGIMAYSYADNEDTFSLVDKGLIGASYYFYDLLNSTYHKHKFNVITDIENTFKKFNARQDRLNVADNFVFDDLPLQEHDARHINRISTTGAYTTRTGGHNTFSQEINENNYRRSIIADATLNLMAKSKLTILTKGSEFLGATGSTVAEHYTIGNTLKIAFPANYPDLENKLSIDPKKSGDYIIYAAKHSFSSESYNISFECTKIGNYNTDILPTGKGLTAV